MPVTNDSFSRSVELTLWPWRRRELTRRRSWKTPLTLPPVFLPPTSRCSPDQAVASSHFILPTKHTGLDWMWVVKLRLNVLGYEEPCMSRLYILLCGAHPTPSWTHSPSSTRHAWPSAEDVFGPTRVRRVVLAWRGCGEGGPGASIIGWVRRNQVIKILHF
jgi:hypothetical protein